MLKFCSRECKIEYSLSKSFIDTHLARYSGSPSIFFTSGVIMLRQCSTFSEYVTPLVEVESLVEIDRIFSNSLYKVFFFLAIVPTTGQPK